MWIVAHLLQGDNTADMRYFPAIAVPVVSILSIVAVPASASHDQQLWTTQTVNVKLNDKWRFQEEIVERFSDNRNGLYEIESNTLLGYRLSKAVTLWAGYTHDPQYSAGDFTVMERRAREQATFDNVATLGQGKLSFRLRTEQRWREGVDGTGWRFRPYVKYALPLAKGSKTVAGSKQRNLPQSQHHAVSKRRMGLIECGRWSRSTRRFQRRSARRSATSTSTVSSAAARIPSTMSCRWRSVGASEPTSPAGRL